MGIRRVGRSLDASRDVGPVYTEVIAADAAETSGLANWKVMSAPCNQQSIGRCKITKAMPEIMQSQRLIQWQAGQVSI